LTKSLSGQKQNEKVRFDPARNGAANAARRTSHVTAVVTGSQDGESDPLAIDPELTRKWLVSFLKDEVVRRRNFKKGIVGLSAASIPR